MVERRTRELRTGDRKVSGSSPGGIIFFTRVNFLCWLLFRYLFHPRVTESHVKDLSHSAKSVDGGLQLDTHGHCDTVNWYMAV